MSLLSVMIGMSVAIALALVLPPYLSNPGQRLALSGMAGIVVTGALLIWRNRVVRAARQDDPPASQEDVATSLPPESLPKPLWSRLIASGLSKGEVNALAGEHAKEIWTIVQQEAVRFDPAAPIAEVIMPVYVKDAAGKQSDIYMESYYPMYFFFDHLKAIAKEWKLGGQVILVVDGQSRAPKKIGVPVRPGDPVYQFTLDTDANTPFVDHRRMTVHVKVVQQVEEMIAKPLVDPGAPHVLNLQKALGDFAVEEIIDKMGAHADGILQGLAHLAQFGYVRSDFDDQNVPFYETVLFALEEYERIMQNEGKPLTPLMIQEIHVAIIDADFASRDDRGHTGQSLVEVAIGIVGGLVLVSGISFMVAAGTVVVPVAALAVVVGSLLVAVPFRQELKDFAVKPYRNWQARRDKAAKAKIADAEANVIGRQGLANPVNLGATRVSSELSPDLNADPETRTVAAAARALLTAA